jgi:hypothetical protein
MHSLTEIEKMFDEQDFCFTDDFNGKRRLHTNMDCTDQVKKFYRSQFSALLTELGEKITDGEKSSRYYINGNVYVKIEYIKSLIQEYLPKNSSNQKENQNED